MGSRDHLFEIADRQQGFFTAKQAEEWCKIASGATKKKWIYKLLPHTAVSRINSFDAIISSAYKIEAA